MDFKEILGRDDVKLHLIDSVSEDRVSHAQLFTGNPGGGNLAIAMAYAAFIHCSEKQEDGPCGNCPSCTKHKKLVHPDLHITYPVAAVKDIRKPKSSDFIEQFRASLISNPYLTLDDWNKVIGTENKQAFISADESNEIIRHLSLKSYESPYKIQVIWLPEKMAPPASNKLLKIIEEPPEFTLFLLVTDQPEQLLPTILSRTQLVKVPKAGDNELMQYLANRMSIKLTSAKRIAHLSGGNISKAIHMAEFDDDEYGHEKRFIHWMRLLLKPMENMVELLDWIDDFASLGRENQKGFMVLSQETVRECLISNHGEKDLVRFDNTVIENFDRFSVFIHAGNSSELMHHFDRSYYAIERNANPKILLLDLSLKISKLLRIPKPASIYTNEV